MAYDNLELTSVIMGRFKYLAGLLSWLIASPLALKSYKSTRIFIGCE